jgi:hypothetical protein
LSDRFRASFEGMRLERINGQTSLIGEISDQAQLHGVLAHAADLGLSIVSFGPVVPGQGSSDVRPAQADG